ncbi:hypothetical protein ACFW2V_13295 [Streptomyces sp. NPDC058947]|uniref:hypothetical protein n=1 Tax=Streptomyces sp. NPDC058947 TaxID=3346675 RepID=UPI0036B3D5CE
MTTPADDEVRQLLVHPAVWPHLTSWLKARGIDLSQTQFSVDDLPTYVMTPGAEPPTTQSDLLGVYTRIFKQLPRETAALLVATVTADPELNGRQTVLAQAALLVSTGHRLGWTDTPTV